MGEEIIGIEDIKTKIYTIRGVQVMLDNDLAKLYGVEVRVLNQAVKRNQERFPEDFMFQLTKEEYNSLRSQFVTLENGHGRHRKYLPYVTSLRDLGQKVFAFSKMEKEGLKILEKIKVKDETEEF